MASRGEHRCPSCKEWFTPDRYNAHRQKYCTEKKKCRKASKAASQKKWLAKNRSYFRGPHNCDRVRGWRLENAGYWRTGYESRKQRKRRKRALQEIAFSQPLGVVPIEVGSVDLLSLLGDVEPSSPTEAVEAILPALQDIALSQHVVATALVHHLEGVALQDPARNRLLRVYRNGRSNWGDVSSPETVRSPDAERDHCEQHAGTRPSHSRSGSTAPGSGCVPLLDHPL